MREPMNLTEDTQRRIDQFNKAASERLGPAYHLIPAESLRRLSRIFLEGLEKYPEGTVNGRNLGGVVGNEPWQTERFNHAVDHLLKWGEGDTSEDHLAKVMWFCSVMIAVRELEQKGAEFVGSYKISSHTGPKANP